jgi:hypothetical protein
MAENGVRTTEFTNVVAIDDIIGNYDGTTVRLSIGALITLIGSRIGPSYASRASLFNDLNWPDGAIGAVYGDPLEIFIGVYKKSGNSGGGTWSRIGDLPVSQATLKMLAEKADLQALLEETDNRRTADIAEQLSRIAGDTNIRDLIGAISTGERRRGSWNPADPFPGGTGVMAGDWWEVSAAGTRDGLTFAIGDGVQALIDTPSTAVAVGNWDKKRLSAIIPRVFTDAPSLIASLDVARGVGAFWQSRDAAFVEVSTGQDLTTDGGVKLRLIGPWRASSFPNSAAFVAAVQTRAADLVASNTMIEVGAGEVIAIPCSPLAGQSLPAFSAWASAAHRVAPGGDLYLKVAAGHYTTTTATVTAGGMLKVRGATPLSRSIASVVSVTGVSGAWDITYALDSAAGITVGDMLLVRDVKPGIDQPGLLSGRPPVGELRLGFFASSSSEITSSGTTINLSKPGINVGLMLAVGDLVIIKGEIRRVQSTGTSTFTINTPLAKDISPSLQYWYHMRGVPATITVAGTAVTGVGTAFTSTANGGDLIYIVGSGVRRIASVNSDTSMTLTKAIEVPTASVFGIHTRGELHDGAWIVNAVSGSNVTVRHTGKSPFAPPIKNVISGSAKALTTTITFPGAVSGIKFGADSNIDFDTIGLFGSGGSSACGIEVSSRLPVEKGKCGNVYLGPEMGISGFGYGVHCEGGSAAYGLGTFISSCTTRGLHVAEGGASNFSSATISGNTGIGYFVGPGGYCRGSDVRVHSNSGDGARFEVGGSAWLDFSYWQDNGTQGMQPVGSVNLHVVGSRFIGNGRGGLYSQNGMNGRGSGLMALCNDDAGISHRNGDFEANQSWLAGNTNNAVCSSGTLLLQEVGANSASSTGIYALTGGQINVTSGVVTCHPIIITAMRADTKGLILGTDTAFKDNLGFDIFIIEASGGLISLWSPVGIVNRNFPEPQTTYTWNAGTLAANAAASIDVPFPGAIVGDFFLVSPNGAFNASLLWHARCITADSVKLSAVNTSTGSVPVGNRTYTIRRF